MESTSQLTGQVEGCGREEQIKASSPHADAPLSLLQRLPRRSEVWVFTSSELVYADWSWVGRESAADAATRRVGDLS